MPALAKEHRLVVPDFPGHGESEKPRDADFSPRYYAHMMRVLMDATGDPVNALGDSFVVHMDREALNDFPLGRYDVTVSISEFEQDKLIAWTILGKIRPQLGHVYGYRLEPDGSRGDATVVTSFYDWSDIDQHWRDAGIFPVISEGALRATLGILDRTVRRGYPRG